MSRAGGRGGRNAPGDESFLNRWSRRKAEARAHEAQEEGRPAAGEAPAEPAQPVEPPPEPLDLPDIESLSAESDFKVFMAKGVPQHLRNQALRKLWRLKPSLANLDGLVDYGEDYTRNATVPATAIRTAYRVGQGYLRKGPAAPDQPDQVAADQPQALPEEAAPRATGEEAAPPATGNEDPSEALACEPAGQASGASADTPAPVSGPTERASSAGQHEAGEEDAPSADRIRPRPLPRRG